MLDNLWKVQYVAINWFMFNVRPYRFVRIFEQDEVSHPARVYAWSKPRRLR